MKTVALILLLPLLLFTDTPEDIASKAETKIRSLRSIQAEFEQIYYSSTVSTPLREKGRFYFKKPDLMKWEYKEPEEKIFLYKEGLFQFYIPEDNQLIQSSISEEGHEAEILSVFSGKRQLKDHYAVEFSPFPTDDQKAWQLKLNPKEEDEYSFILLEIDAKTWLIQKAIFFDWAGNKTEFKFSKIKTNARFRKNLFELNLPPGVEIIENQTDQF